MFPCVHNSHSMFSLGPCDSCKRQGLRGVKIRSAETVSRSSHQQFSGRSDRSIPVQRSSELSIPWPNPRDQQRKLLSRYHEIVDNKSNVGKFGYQTNKPETHHFSGGSFQLHSYRQVDQRASLGSRSGPRTFLGNTRENQKETREQFRTETPEQQYRLTWDRSKYPYDERLDSRGGQWPINGGDRLDSRGGPRPINSGDRLDSRGGQRPWNSVERLDSRERLGSRGGQRTWFDNEPRYINSQGSERRFNLWSRPSTRERSPPTETKVTRRRVHLVESPQVITESRLEKMEKRSIFPPIPNDQIKSILKRGKPKCVIVVHGKG